jgi:uncharacterized protein YjbI with pentapeptide repeats
MNTSLSEAVFDDARVRGFFYDWAASLVGTDLSHSQFVGPRGGNRFGRARLIETRFRYTKISTAVFKRAVMEKADFLGAVLAPEIAPHLTDRKILPSCVPGQAPVDD